MPIVFGLSAGVLTRSLPLGFLAFGIAAAFPFFWNAYRRRQALLRISQQLRSSLQVLVYALEAGASLRQALERVATEESAPLGDEWRTLCRDLQIGTPMGVAFASLADRVPLREMRWLGVLMQITQQTGGSIAPLLSTLSDNVLQKELLREKIASLTAQGRASGYLLCALPGVLVAALGVIAPDLVEPLFNTTRGQFLLTVAAGMIAVGFLLIQKIVHVEVE